MPIRYTQRYVEERIDLVKRIAANMGLKELNYNGALFSTLRIQSAFSDPRLIAGFAGNGVNWMTVSEGRSWREIANFLDGMIVALDAMRYVDPNMVLRALKEGA